MSENCWFQENRVQMADQENAFRRLIAIVDRNEATGMVHARRQVVPSGLEAKRLQLRLHQITHFDNTFNVICTAVDVDELLKQRNLLSDVAVDIGRHALLITCRSCRYTVAEKQNQERGEKTFHAG